MIRIFVFLIIFGAKGANAQDGPLFSLSELISEDDKYEEIIFSKRKYMGVGKIVKTKYKKGVVRYSKNIDVEKIERILMDIRDSQGRYWSQGEKYFITKYKHNERNTYLMIYPGFGLCFSGFYEDELYALIEISNDDIKLVGRGSTSGMEC